MLTVSFFGVRGSTPCPCSANTRYGGNTACVVVESPGQDPILLDLGTGLRQYGETIAPGVPFRGTALVTHLHWDHVQGLPFFPPILRDGAALDVYGPTHDGVGLEAAFARFMTPPFFPVQITDLPGEVRFHDVGPGSFDVGDARVTVAYVPHIGETHGYRIERGGATVAYVSDHQQPGPGDLTVSDEVVALCRDVDLLIHDAQYTDDEFLAKADWGHCTVDFAVEVAVRAGARRLALFHHDPSHDDATLDRLADHARTLTTGTPVQEVIIAAEGLSVALAQSVPRVAAAI